MIGGNAVMAWVEQVDESAVRFTPDVHLVLRREDLDRATEALAKAGFVHRWSAGIDMFLDGPAAEAPKAASEIRNACLAICGPNQSCERLQVVRPLLLFQGYLDPVGAVAGRFQYVFSRWGRGLDGILM